MRERERERERERARDKYEYVCCTNVGTREKRFYERRVILYGSVHAFLLLRCPEAATTYRHLHSTEVLLSYACAFRTV